MPGLPKAPFLENAAKRPDLIGAWKSSEIIIEAHSSVFRTWAYFPFSGTCWTEGRTGKIKARQTLL
jgi:hypothetical protein